MTDNIIEDEREESTRCDTTKMVDQNDQVQHTYYSGDENGSEPGLEQLQSNRTGSASVVEPGQSSPTTSSAMSVSSFPPSLVSSFLQKQSYSNGESPCLPYELTPVIRNTSSGTSTRDDHDNTITGSAPVAPNINTGYKGTSYHRGATRPPVVSPLEGKRHVQLEDFPSFRSRNDPSSGNERGYTHTSGPSLVLVGCCSPSDKEHLSLPTDLADNSQDDTYHQDMGLSSLPSLRVVSGTSTLSQEQSHEQATTSRSPSVLLQPPSFQRSTTNDVEKMLLHNPIVFPTRKKFNSFTSRQQYENRKNAEVAAMELTDFSDGHYNSRRSFREQSHFVDDDDDEDSILGYHDHHPLHHALRPYQPSRQDDAVLETPPEEELSQIFAARARFYENPSGSDGSGNVGLGEKRHRLASATPMQSWFAGDGETLTATHGPQELQPQGSREHQFSGIHLAHRLSTTATTTTDNASITTFTTLNTWCEDDDDEDLLNNSSSIYESWSNSNNNDSPSKPPHVEEDENGCSSPQRHPRKSSGTTSVVVEGIGGEELTWASLETPKRAGFGRYKPYEDKHDDYDAHRDTEMSQYSTGRNYAVETLSFSSADPRDISTDNDTTMAVDGRHQKEQEALEWIQSLQASSQNTLTSPIAEAASSKFLCGTTGSPLRSSPGRRRLVAPTMLSSPSRPQPLVS